jgi:hypothetical protein
MLKNFDIFLDNKFFLGFQNVFSIGWAIIWAEKNNLIVKEILDFYETKKTRIILPNLLNKIFKNYWINQYFNKILSSNEFTIYPKEYFYPYAYFEKKENIKIEENTYTIHHYDATWLPKIITKYIFPLIWIIAKYKTK